jgi:hypothetical protein
MHVPRFCHILFPLWIEVQKSKIERPPKIPRTGTDAMFRLRRPIENLLPARTQRARSRIGSRIRDELAVELRQRRLGGVEAQFRVWTHRPEAKAAMDKALALWPGLNLSNLAPNNPGISMDTKILSAGGRSSRPSRRFRLLPLYLAPVEIANSGLSRVHNLYEPKSGQTIG